MTFAKNQELIMKKIFFVLIGLLGLNFATAFAQLNFMGKVEFTKDDTLRGSITPERSWWDLTYYELRQKVDPINQYLTGSTKIFYKVLDNKQVMQVDLQPPMKLVSAVQDSELLDVKQVGTNAYFITLKKKQQIGNLESVLVSFEGKPRQPRRPPWDGGVQWQKDKQGNDFIATTCQGLGSSVWWACKDHMYDEPDSMLISVTVPEPLMDVSNGRLRKVTHNKDRTATYDWFVNNPINNYGVNMNVGAYAHFADTLNGEKGVLDLNYYVLRYNVNRAKEQFKQAKLMLRAFENWFGPYPFYEDSYKLVEVPYLGMEHQSSVTYGNEYMNGYLGNDLSGTGWGLKWDYIIIHESGHEWFANNITYKDIADMWIHEGFTYYSEALFTEYYYGKEAGSDYIVGSRRGIWNRTPLIGKYNVNNEGSSDMYNKGGNILHTIRQLAKDDENWRQTLRGLNKEFYHQTVTTDQIEKYISKSIGRDLTKFFDQYLRDNRVPSFEFKKVGNAYQYRWANTIDGFTMPIKVSLDGKNYQWISPTADWQNLTAKVDDKLTLDRNFYVFSKEVE